MWTLLMLPALAASPGVPMPEPDVARVQLDLTGATAVVSGLDDGCAGGDDCARVPLQHSVGAELSVALVSGLGLYGSVSRVSLTESGTAYAGDGLSWGVGARGALPLTDLLGVAAEVELGAASTEGEGGGQSAYKERSTRLLATFGSMPGGGAAWAGAERCWGWEMDLSSPSTEVEGELVSSTIVPERPLSLVLGGALSSAPIGLPWKASPRLSAGAELRFGQVRAVGAWVGLGI